MLTDAYNYSALMSQQNTDLGPVEPNEMGVLSLTSRETVSYQIIAK